MVLRFLDFFCWLYRCSYKWGKKIKEQQIEKQKKKKKKKRFSGVISFLKQEVENNE
jgi:hypothetical protein